MIAAEAEQRMELKSRRYAVCEGKNNTCTHQSPGEIVRVDDTGTELALCYGCRTALPKGSYRIVYWIKADGLVRIN